MSYDQADRCLALAGVFQAVYLAQQLASHGRSEAEPFEASIRSIFVVDAGATTDVFGGAVGVVTGLQLLRDRLSRQASREDIELARYALSVIQLERRLFRNQVVLKRLTDGIAATARQSEFFDTGDGDPVHSNVVAALADLYSNTLSLLPPRIMIRGEPHILGDEAIANRIRAVLLAGVRAAVLWRQVGGRRWHLVFRRQPYTEGAARLIRSLGAGSGDH